MSDKPDAASHDPQGRDNAAVLILTLADTTWRMLVPTAALSGAGLWLDLHWHTKPWLTLLSIPLGLAISVLLIRQQLRKVPS